MHDDATQGVFFVQKTKMTFRYLHGIPLIIRVSYSMIQQSASVREKYKKNDVVCMPGTYMVSEQINNKEQSLL